MVRAWPTIDFTVPDVVIELVKPNVIGPDPPTLDPGIAEIHLYPLDTRDVSQGFDNRLLKVYAKASPTLWGLRSETSLSQNRAWRNAEANAGGLWRFHAFTNVIPAI
jgi:hypothetical protein